MRAAVLLPFLAAIAGPCLAAEERAIAATELTLGGIAIGATEAQVTTLLGQPGSRTNTGEGFKLSYPRFDVYVAVAGGVFDLVSTNPSKCTPSKACPGMPVKALERRYGSPIVAKREQGTFLEYIPAGSTCWLQASIANDVVHSLRVACQP